MPCLRHRRRIHQPSEKGSNERPVASPPWRWRELWIFLGLASSYRRFVQDFALIASPLHWLTQKGQPFQWGGDWTAVFNWRLHSSSTQTPVTWTSGQCSLRMKSRGSEWLLTLAACSTALNETMASPDECCWRYPGNSPLQSGGRFLLRTGHASENWSGSWLGGSRHFRIVTLQSKLTSWRIQSYSGNPVSDHDRPPAVRLGPKPASGLMVALDGSVYEGHPHGTCSGLCTLCCRCGLRTLTTYLVRLCGV